MSGSLARARRLGGVLRREGPRGVVQRGLRAMASRFEDGELALPVLADLADSRNLKCPVDVRPLASGRPITVAWVMTPPSLGSGGHTTLFRMVEALETAGHTCRLMLYDRFGATGDHQEAVIRKGWPRVKARVFDVGQGFDGCDVAIATSWQTAHVLAARSRTPMKYCYLVQDFEPYFYPLGATSALAEETYQFGFHHLTIGPALAEILAERSAVTADVVDFGCDTDVYRLTNTGDRSGVVFYTKPEVPRRGYLLGKFALELFHQRHPEQPIHLFGSAVPDLPFPAVRHGTIRPDELNALYNQSIAGLALSFTNVSLAPEEMLAAGMIPVVNESAVARVVLDNPHAEWVHPSPAAVADALSAIVSAPGVPQRAAVVAASVTARNWSIGQRMFVSSIERIAYGEDRGPARTR